MLLVLYGALGAVHMSPMGEGLSGGCPFMPGVNLCDMTPLAHLSTWESSFTALAAQSIGALLVLALVALALLSFSPMFLVLRAVSQPVRRATLSPARHELHDAFSDGILNPKIF